MFFRIFFGVLFSVLSCAYVPESASKLKRAGVIEKEKVECLGACRRLYRVLFAVQTQ